MIPQRYLKGLSRRFKGLKGAYTVPTLGIDRYNVPVVLAGFSFGGAAIWPVARELHAVGALAGVVSIAGSARGGSCFPGVEYIKFFFIFKRIFRVCIRDTLNISQQTLNRHLF